jgi:hypothetical protein
MHCIINIICAISIRLKNIQYENAKNFRGQVYWLFFTSCHQAENVSHKILHRNFNISLMMEDRYNNKGFINSFYSVVHDHSEFQSEILCRRRSVIITHKIDDFDILAISSFATKQYRFVYSLTYE